MATTIGKVLGAIVLGFAVLFCFAMVTGAGTVAADHSFAGVSGYGPHPLLELVFFSLSCWIGSFVCGVVSRRSGGVLGIVVVMPFVMLRAFWVFWYYYNELYGDMKPGSNAYQLFAALLPEPTATALTIVTGLVLAWKGGEFGVSVGRSNAELLDVNRRGILGVSWWHYCWLLPCADSAIFGLLANRNLYWPWFSWLFAIEKARNEVSSLESWFMGFDTLWVALVAGAWVASVWVSIGGVVSAWCKLSSLCAGVSIGRDAVVTALKHGLGGTALGWIAQQALANVTVWYFMRT